MKIHITIPFATDKDLGKAYNEACAMVPDGDWICILDHDVMFLTPDAINIMYGYVERNPDVGLLTCYANRIHQSSPQLFDRGMMHITDISYHINVAEKQKQHLYEVTEVDKNISGFLMLFSKETWKQFPFKEGAGCLGIDTAFWQSLVSAGKKILRMDGLYVFHTYRLQNGIQNKDHLK